MKHFAFKFSQPLMTRINVGSRVVELLSSCFIRMSGEIVVTDMRFIHVRDKTHALRQ